MQVSEHFSYKELIYSDVATRKRIDNHPSQKEYENLKALCKEVLEPIRSAFGQPMIVTSGYRCPRLNSLVGGAKNSDHVLGCAVDIRTVSDKWEENKILFDTVVSLVDSGIIQVRQVIDEYNYNWIHISINRGRDNKYNEILHLE